MGVRGKVRRDQPVVMQAPHSWQTRVDGMSLRKRGGQGSEIGHLKCEGFRLQREVALMSFQTILPWSPAALSMSQPHSV